MANDLTARPIVLDTSGATSDLTGPLKVTHVVLVGGSTATSFRIADQSAGDNTLVQGSTAAATTLVVPVNQTWFDMTLDAIAGTGAIVLVYTR